MTQKGNAYGSLIYIYIHTHKRDQIRAITDANQKQWVQKLSLTTGRVSLTISASAAVNLPNLRTENLRNIPKTHLCDSFMEIFIYSLLIRYYCTFLAQRLQSTTYTVQRSCKRGVTAEIKGKFLNNHEDRGVKGICSCKKISLWRQKQ